VTESKGKAVAEKNLEEFMKDSLFNEGPMARTFEARPRPVVTGNDRGKPSKKNLNELGDLIDELNDVVGKAEETGEEFSIPELPAGQELSLTLLSNWGSQSFVGLNGVELFDSDGEPVRPSACRAVAWAAGNFSRNCSSNSCSLLTRRRRPASQKANGWRCR
jgi:hypothetical protein